MNQASPGLGPEIVGELEELRTAMAQLLTELPQTVSRAVDVERNLELDKKLAWQVFRIARDPDPRAAGSRIPGPSATRRLVQAARKVRVTDGVCQRVEGAIQKCRGLIDEYARDRATFELMVSAVTGDGLEARNAELKRSAFRVNGQIFGRQCDLTVFSLIVMPGEEPDTVHLVSVRGLEGLCSYRPLAGLEISRHRFDHASGEVQARTPVEPSIRDDEPIALLRAFSTSPFPAIRQVRGRDRLRPHAGRDERTRSPR